MFTLIRAFVYASLFVGFLLIYAPAGILARAGITRPAVMEWEQIAGLAIGTVGAAIALWCVLTFSLFGKGTPAPFDPPRKLVIRGPYRYVRNPMYLGAVSALSGAAWFYHSIELLGYAVFFLLCMHALVVLYEEPTLRRTFGEEYHNYCKQVKRWLPGKNKDA